MDFYILLLQFSGGIKRFLKKKQFGGHADNSIVSSFPSKKEGKGILFHSHSTETVFQLLTIILKGRNLWGKYINIVTIWATSCHEEGGGIGQVDCKHNAWHILLTTETQWCNVESNFLLKKDACLCCVLHLAGNVLFLKLCLKSLLCSLFFKCFNNYWCTNQQIASV